MAFRLASAAVGWLGQQSVSLLHSQTRRATDQAGMNGKASRPYDRRRLLNAAHAATCSPPSGEPYSGFTTQRARWAVASAIALVLVSAPAALAASTATVQFSDVTFQTSFPSGISFHAHVQSQASPIEAAWFECQVPGDAAPYGVNVPVTPALQLKFELCVGPSPSTPASGRYRRVSLAGQRCQRQPSLERQYNGQLRRHALFNWDRLLDGGIEVWWHDAPGSLGSEALAIAAAGGGAPADVLPSQPAGICPHHALR